MPTKTNGSEEEAIHNRLRVRLDQAITACLEAGGDPAWIREILEEHIQEVCGD